MGLMNISPLLSPECSSVTAQLPQQQRCTFIAPTLKVNGSSLHLPMGSSSLANTRKATPLCVVLQVHSSQIHGDVEARLATSISQAIPMSLHLGSPSGATSPCLKLLTMSPTCVAPRR